MKIDTSKLRKAIERRAVRECEEIERRFPSDGSSSDAQAMRAYSLVEQRQRADEELLDRIEELAADLASDRRS